MFVLGSACTLAANGISLTGYLELNTHLLPPGSFFKATLICNHQTARLACSGRHCVMQLHQDCSLAAESPSAAHVAPAMLVMQAHG